MQKEFWHIDEENSGCVECKCVAEQQQQQQKKKRTPDPIRIRIEITIWTQNQIYQRNNCRKTRNNNWHNGLD